MPEHDFHADDLGADDLHADLRADDEVARRLIRRAYAHDPVVTPPVGDVVRRAGRPETPGFAEPAWEERRRRTWAVPATFAAAVAIVLVIAYAAGHVGGGGAPAQVGAHGSASATAPSGSALPGVPPGPGSAEPSGLTLSQEPGSPGASAAPSTSAGAPQPLPTSCASAWNLLLQGDTFRVTARAGYSCGHLTSQRIWLLDAAHDDGTINPGDATIWPVQPKGSTGGFTGPPFTFRPAGWGGPVHGHYYVLMFLAEEETHGARPGADAAGPYATAHVISLHVIA